MVLTPLTVPPSSSIESGVATSVATMGSSSDVMLTVTGAALLATGSPPELDTVADTSTLLDALRRITASLSTAVSSAAPLLVVCPVGTDSTLFVSV